MDDQVRAVARQDANGRWRAEADGVSGSGLSLDQAVGALRKGLDASGRGERVILVEAYPRLLGVAETAAFLRWDKRRVITYVTRGSFPRPVAALASGRVWALDDVTAFRDEFRARQKRRA